MIFVSHGVVNDLDPRRISHALMLSRGEFIRHLQQRAARYVPIEQAVLGLGDALTVDDATQAGLDQVLLARRFGHAVTWFVNGENVEQRLPYFPFLLSWMVDETDAPDCLLEGQVFPLRTFTERRAFRRSLKRIYLRSTAEQHILDLVSGLAFQLHQPNPCTPPFLSTASRCDLEHAVRAGVVLGNHGWDHLNPLALPTSTCVASIDRNRTWLNTLQPEHRAYAPPFGARVALPQETCSLMLLADPTLADLACREPTHTLAVINRSPLDLRSHTIFSTPPNTQKDSLRLISA